MSAELDRWDGWNMGGGPTYPHDKVVQFLLRRYPDRAQRNDLNVLDLGCGGGVHMEFLVREGFRAHGRDFSPVAIETTRARLRAAGLTAASIATGSVEKINTPDAQFDAVICIGVLDCAGPERLAPALAEIVRVLRSGGAALALFASARDFRVLGDNPLFLHGFDDHELRQALAGLPACLDAIWMDQLITTYRNRTQEQNEHLLTLIKDQT